MKFHQLPLAVLSLLCLCVCSCGESFVKIADRHQAELTAFQADLAGIAAALPADPGQVSELPLSKVLDPAPKFISDDLAASNVIITPFELLTEPDAQLDKETQMDFYANEVKNYLIWSKQDQKSHDGFEEGLLNAFQMRYVAVYQTLFLKNPSMIDDKTYDKGGVVILVQLYDREIDKVVCAFPFMATANDEVSFRHSTTSSGLSEGLSAARSSMWVNAREQFFAKLAEKTGGKFEP